MLSPEAFCDYVKTALLAGLQAQLDAQTAKWAAADLAAGRTIDLTVPDADSIYIGGAPVAIKYPAIEVAVPDLGFASLSLENFDGDATPTLMVRTLFQEVKSVELLYRTGCRWFAAIVACISAPGALGEVDIDKDRGIRGAWRFNPETGTVDEIQSGVLATFWLAGPLSPFSA